MAKNRERQRYNKKIKDQLIELKNSEGYVDSTPNNAVNSDLVKQFAGSKREYEAIKSKQTIGRNV